MLNFPHCLVRLALSVLILAAPHVFATQAERQTLTTTLENGLRVYVREDRRAPIVVSQIWYEVGSSYEPVGLTGISHVLEHLMFKGTERMPAGHFSKLVSLYGGSENAFTSRDYTGYFQAWGKSRLPISFELEADRMQHLRLTQTQFDQEIKVVMEERRLRVDDQPTSKTYEHLLAAAYASSPYGQPIVGWMHDLEALQLSDIQAWYETWYAPNNAHLIVVGDVVAQEVFALAEAYFGKIPARKVPTAPAAAEIEPLGEKQLQVRLGVEVEELFLAFEAPNLKPGDHTWESYALMLLASVLDGGYSARFQSQLVRDQGVAASVGAGYSGLSRGPTQFIVHAIPAQGHSLDQLERAIFAEIERVSTVPVASEEIERVLAQVLSSRVFSQDSISAQAREIGNLVALGYPANLLDNLSTRLAEITPEQIQQVAQRYLTRDRLTLARLVSNE